MTGAAEHVAREWREAALRLADCAMHASPETEDAIEAVFALAVRGEEGEPGKSHSEPVPRADAAEVAEAALRSGCPGSPSSSEATAEGTLRAQLNHLGPWRSQVGLEALAALVAERDALREARNDYHDAMMAAQAKTIRVTAERDAALARAEEATEAWQANVKRAKTAEAEVALLTAERRRVLEAFQADHAQLEAAREALRGTVAALTIWETAVGEINVWPRQCRQALAAARAALAVAGVSPLPGEAE